MLIEQAADGVLSLQRDVASNAAAHKQWAVAESVPLIDLQTMIADVLTAYEWRRAKLRHFRDVTIPADSGFLTVGDQLMLTLQSVGVVGTAVADHIDAFAAMLGATSDINQSGQTAYAVPGSVTYAQIISACDYLLANVQPPETVWD
jgi:hypothetical protein